MINDNVAASSSWEVKILTPARDVFLPSALFLWSMFIYNLSLVIYVIKLPDKVANELVWQVMSDYEYDWTKYCWKSLDVWNMWTIVSYICYVIHLPPSLMMPRAGIKIFSWRYITSLLSALSTLLINLIFLMIRLKNKMNCNLSNIFRMTNEKNDRNLHVSLLSFIAFQPWQSQHHQLQDNSNITIT